MLRKNNAKKTTQYILQTKLIEGKGCQRKSVILSFFASHMLSASEIQYSIFHFRVAHSIKVRNFAHICIKTI